MAHSIYCRETTGGELADGWRPQPEDSIRNVQHVQMKKKLHSKNATWVMILGRKGEGRIIILRDSCH